jgi:hypothetical protein
VQCLDDIPMQLIPRCCLGEFRWHTTILVCFPARSSSIRQLSFTPTRPCVR